MALLNLFTKKTATIWGLSFTLIIFAVLQWSERRQRRAAATQTNAEQFQLEQVVAIDASALNLRPGSTLIPVRNPYQLDHLRRVLDHVDAHQIDLVAMTVRTEAEAEIFDSQVQDLFSRVVHVAEKAGKPVKLLAVSGRDADEAIVETAQRIGAETVVMGLSGKYRSADAPREQAKSFGDAWEKLPAPRPQMTLEIVEGEQAVYFHLGPHPPRLWPQDLELLHGLWLRMSASNPGLRHRDVVHLALTKLEREL
jgi:nucleotide-binding universal stress UspA family protein